MHKKTLLGRQRAGYSTLYEQDIKGVSRVTNRTRTYMYISKNDYYYHHRPDHYHHYRHRFLCYVLLILFEVC